MNEQMLPFVCMPTVRLLTLEINPHHAFLLPLLDFPCVIRMAFRLFITERNPESGLKHDLEIVDNVMLSMFSAKKKGYPCLTTFVLWLSATEQHNHLRLPADLFSPVRAACPEIERLGFATHFDEQDVLLPPVRRLGLAGGLDGRFQLKPSLAWMAKYPGQLRCAGLWDGFERLDYYGSLDSDSSDQSEVREVYGDKLNEIRRDKNRMLNMELWETWWA